MAADDLVGVADDGEVGTVCEDDLPVSSAPDRTTEIRNMVILA
jgi:hypothetical protein